MRALAFVLVLALSLPARAIDCQTVPDPKVGSPWTEDQMQCLQMFVVKVRYERDAAQIEAVRQAALASACEATASITCPRPEVPVGAFLAGVGTGVVLAIVAATLTYALTR